MGPEIENVMALRKDALESVHNAQTRAVQLSHWFVLSSFALSAFYISQKIGIITPIMLTDAFLIPFFIATIIILKRQIDGARKTVEYYHELLINIEEDKKPTTWRACFETKLKGPIFKLRDEINFMRGTILLIILKNLVLFLIWKQLLEGVSKVIK